MDISSLSISLPIALTIVGCFIGVMTYISNRNRNSKKDNEEDQKKASEQEARMVRIETMLVTIEHNTSNLNSRVNDHDKLLTKHETRISVLEEKINTKKGK